jgi:thiamine kinase-like enzyme
MKPETLERIRALRCWEGEVAIAPLKGGLSNESYRVTDAAGQHVVRLGRDYPFHHVSREREMMVARAAHAAGFAPAVQYSEPGLMVTQFLGAKTFAAEDVRAEVERVAGLIHRFHAAMPRQVHGPGYMFWVFHVIRDYARTLSDRSRLREHLPGWIETSDALERIQVPLPIVFGHNDLLPANFLDTGDRLWLIDFEYAGHSTAMFDLAGIASNAGFNAEQSYHLLELYFGRPPERELMRSHDAMQCASLLRETLWSLVSELYLETAGVDYEAYTAENLTRFEASLDRYQTAYGKIPK